MENQSVQKIILRKHFQAKKDSVSKLSKRIEFEDFSKLSSKIEIVAQ